MIFGHGDDAYRYGAQIKMDFSSNIYFGADLSGLQAHWQAASASWAIILSRRP